MFNWSTNPPAKDWESVQASVGQAHFLQSRPWALFQLALGRRAMWSTGDGWSWVGYEYGSKGVKYLYVPYGPSAASQEACIRALQSVRQLATNLGVDFARVEPLDYSSALREVETVSATETQPKFTTVVDLTADEAVLRSALSSGHRNAVNSAERRGLNFRTSQQKQDIQKFLALMMKTGQVRGFKPHSSHYFTALLETLMPIGAAKLYIAEKDGECIAAAIGFEDAATAYYAHAAANPLARKLQAAVPLVWFMLSEAKNGGRRKFDLWGIAPPSEPNHPWAGFSQFKLAFGGEVVEYSGTWDMVLKPAKYKAYKIAKRLIG